MHTNYEKKMLSSLMKVIDVSTDELMPASKKEEKKEEKKVSIMRKQDETEKQGFMSFCLRWFQPPEQGKSVNFPSEFR